jgi:hypothetical protein
MKISQQVENILRAISITRSSDKELYLIFMEKSGMNLTPEQQDTFRRMPSLETVRRTRQLIQEQGKYLPTAEVEQARYDKFKRMRGGEDIERVLEDAPWVPKFLK